jgi:hypothetical protein
MLGDIHLLRDYPPGAPWEQITEFEIWDGLKWVHAMETARYAIEDRRDGP